MQIFMVSGQVFINAILSFLTIMISDIKQTLSMPGVAVTQHAVVLKRPYYVFGGFPLVCHISLCACTRSAKLTSHVNVRGKGSS